MFKKIYKQAIAILFSIVFCGPTLVAQAYTEQRQPCADHQLLRQPLFGDLHVHTKLSFDSFLSAQRNGPDGAYRYAKGLPITLPDADSKQTVIAQISRPLDFTAVTDHAEFLGETLICQDDPESVGYWWPMCILARTDSLWLNMIAASLFNDRLLSMNVKPDRSLLCSMPGVDCNASLAKAWAMVQQAAEQHYDRSESCTFTTFIGYEFTDHPQQKNMHRNVIFRNVNVPDVPTSVFNTGTNNFPSLWSSLRSECIEAGNNCDVMSIPHNSNLSGGLMFRTPTTKLEATERLFFEPLIELVQHKASSECRFDRLAGQGLNTEDELCDFEQTETDNLSVLSSIEGKLRTDAANPVSLNNYASRNMIRNVLKDGLLIGAQSPEGINPFKMGFIGSTDTHSASPGGAEEANYLGHLGRRDSGYRNIQDHFYDNPGGLAVVWAEENSRDSIFTAMRRKEAYATSGTRPIIRVFGGWNYPKNLCDSSDLIAQGYENGVPMGGDLPERPEGASPKFVISAMKDPGIPGRPGFDLQRIQVIKGWLDKEGTTHEQVYNVAGDPNNGATIDPASCAPLGKGHSHLCTVWEDTDFDPRQDAFYYARVIENPSCRWSTLQCKAAGVDPFSTACQSQAKKQNAMAKEKGAAGDVYSKCCISKEESSFYSPIIQERAWTSPIWYQQIQ